MATVILSQPQRDGLRDFIGSRMALDLSISTRHDDWQEIRDAAGILNDCIPVLDEIGWERAGARHTYTVEVDADLIRLAGEIKPSIEGTIRDDLRGGEELTARDQRILEGDRHALAAVDLIEGTVA